MKRSLAEVGEKNITIEIDALDVRRIACELRHSWYDVTPHELIFELQRLRRSMHIAQPSHVIDDPRWNSLMGHLQGPTLLMEWIENGLLWDLYEKKAGSDEPLPNRLLWSLFLCCKHPDEDLCYPRVNVAPLVCRMVAGMAWPPRDFGRRADGKPILEVIPPRNQRGERPPKSRLLHGDFHGRNGRTKQAKYSKRWKIHANLSFSHD